MKIKSIVGFLMVGGSLWLSSCKDDEPSKSGVSFETSEESVKESDGTLQSFHPLMVQNATGREIEVKIQFDEPLAQKAVIEYSIGGTATQNSTTEPYGDFDIDGNGENITIEKGATEAIITIMLFEDYDFELVDQNQDGNIEASETAETIEITLESVISGPVKISEDNTYILTIYEDDTIVVLNWDGDSFDETPGDVDMDLFIWLDGVIEARSVNIGNDPEGIAIPGGYAEDTYGMSYTYYSGTLDPLEFTVLISNLGGTLNGSDEDLTFTGSYTVANINTYDPEDNDPDVLVVQTMVKSGFNYTNISDITEPGVGSKIGRSTLSLKERIKGMNISTFKDFKRK